MRTLVVAYEYSCPTNSATRLDLLTQLPGLYGSDPSQRLGGRSADKVTGSHVTTVAQVAGAAP